jgi:cation transport ATPase
LGRRSRQRERSGDAFGGAASAPPPSRSEQRNEEARSALKPLAPGERPTAVTIAAAVSALLAVGNVIAYAAGLTVNGDRPQAYGVVAFTLLMLTAAWGMWNARYWAVLGFQALLAITIIIAALSLAVASSLPAAVLCVTLVFFGGWLFWKLIRAMARIQMPTRR